MKLPHLELLQVGLVGGRVALFLFYLPVDRRMFLPQFLEMRVQAHAILLVTGSEYPTVEHRMPRLSSLRHRRRKHAATRIASDRRMKIGRASWRGGADAA